MTFVDHPVCDMRVDPAGILSDHALVTCRLPVTVDQATVVERLVHGWRRVDRDELQQALMDSSLCHAVSDGAPWFDDNCRPACLECRRLEHRYNRRSCSADDRRHWIDAVRKRFWLYRSTKEVYWSKRLSQEGHSQPLLW